MKILKPYVLDHFDKSLKDIDGCTLVDALKYGMLSDRFHQQHPHFDDTIDTPVLNVKTEQELLIASAKAGLTPNQYAKLNGFVKFEDNWVSPSSTTV